MKKKLLILTSGLFAFLSGYAQSNPTPFDLSGGNYTFTQWDDTEAAGTYPANMIFHRTGTQDPTLSATENADYTGDYNLGSGARINGLGTDGFSFINTGTAGNFGMAVIGLNATDRENITLTYTVGTVVQNSRIYKVRLQYRVSSSSSWLDVPGPVEYEVNTNGHSETFSGIVLPNTCNNQPDVQVRWFYYFESGTGARPQIRIDDITITSALITTPAINVNIGSSLSIGTEADETAITITATAESAVTGDQTVTIDVSGTNITAGDYSLSSATITILDGQTVGNTTFTITNDNLNEGTENANISISGISAGLAIGTVSSINIEITDNDDAIELNTINVANAVIDFNELQNTGVNLVDMTRGFYSFEDGTNANEFYRADNGTSTTGDTYSFGATSSSERALGSLTTGPLSPNSFGAKVKNSTGTNMNALTVSYTGEQWRGGAAAEDTLKFYYSTDATALDNGTWNYIQNLNFEAIHISNAVTSELDGNDGANQTNITYQITGLNIIDNQEIWIKWVDNDVASSDHGLAIDDLILTPQFISTPIITGLPTSLSGFNQVLGSPSAEQSFTISGDNLTDDLVVNAPTNYEISLTSGAGFTNTINLAPASGTVTTTTIYVRLNASANATYNENIVASSTGASDLVISLSGVTADPFVVPTLFINEFLASNSTVIADENGEFDDWIEIYNPTSSAVDLAGFYLTDDLANLTKYQIPTTSIAAVVPANGWLLFWADNQSAQGDLHTNFALSASGEDLALVAPDGMTIIDQYTFSTQSQNVSEGRDGDGNATWKFFSIPTPNATNIDVSSIYENNQIKIQVYPNPTNGLQQLNISEKTDVRIYDINGRIVLESLNSNLIDVSSLENGLYIIQTTEGSQFKLVINN